MRSIVLRDPAMIIEHINEYLDRELRGEKGGDGLCVGLVPPTEVMRQDVWKVAGHGDDGTVGISTRLNNITEYKEFFDELKKKYSRIKRFLLSQSRI